MNKLTLWLTFVLMAALAGCGGGGSSDGGGEAPPLARPTGTALVGAAGATVEGVDGARVDIPAGAMGTVGAELSISIARDSTDAPPVPAGFRPLGDVFAVTPHGVHFKRPVTVTVPFDVAALPADRKPALIKVTPGKPWEVIENVTVNGNTVSAQVTSLSYFVPVSAPRAGWVIVNPQTPPPGAQASISMVLENSGWTSLPPTGTNARIVLQTAVDDPAIVRWQVAVPAASDLAQSCWSGDVRVRLTAENAALYRRPSDPAAGTNRVAGDPSTRGVIGGLYASDTLQTELTAVFSNGALWNPLPPGRVGLAALLGPSPDIPADAIIDGVGVQVQMEVRCIAPDDGTGGGFFDDPNRNVIWVNQVLIPPIVVARGFSPPRIAVVVNPPSRSFLQGQYVSDQPIEAQWALNFTLPPNELAQGNAFWERAAPGSNIWQPVPTVLFGDPPPANTLYSIARSDTILPETTRLLGQTLAARDNGWRYRAVFCLAARGTEPRVCATSRPATLRVSTQYPQPRITTQPRSQTFQAGQTLSLNTAFAGFPLPTRVTWQTRTADGQPWVDADQGTWLNLVRPDAIPDLEFWQSFNDGADTLVSTRPLTVADRGRQFRATYTTLGGTATSLGATINVTTGQTPPTISAQPNDLTAGAGQTAVLTALADGAMPLSYQWTFNGQRIPGANTPTLVLGTVNAANAGLYALEVTNVEDTVRSRSARLTVTGATPPAPLAITTGPAAQSVAAGGSVTLAVVASGAPPVAYQWEYEGQPITGATSAVLTLANVSQAQAGNYVVVVSNGSTSLRSLPALLTVQTVQPPVSLPPTIDVSPAGLTVAQGQRAILAVGAGGSGPLTYQWLRGGSVLPGANSAVLLIEAAGAADGGNYTVTVTNSAGSVTSNAAGLVVTPAPGIPAITAQPANRSVFEGQRATFSLAVTGSPIPQCQWTRNGVAMVGAISCTGYTTGDTTLADNGAVYNVVVYSPGGVAFGNGALLTVAPGAAAVPVITQDLADVSAPEGGTATFSVVASANGPLFHYWTRIGAPTTPLGGSSFDIGPLQASDDGATVRVIVCNGPIADNRCTTSRDARLTVTPAVPANALTATQVVTGQEWSMVLRPDRTVWGWGSVHRANGTVQYFNQTLAPALRPVRMYPAVLSDVRAISGWFNSFWALKGEPGTTGSRVLHWGRAFAGTDGRGGDGNGSLGSSIPTRDNEAAPVEVLERVNNVPQPVDRVCAIAGGGEQLAMIRAINSAGTTTDCNAGSAKTVWFVGSLLSRGYESTGVAFAMPGLPTDSPPAVIFTGQTTSGSPGLAIALEDGRVYGLGANPYGGFGIAPSGSGIVGGLSGPQLLPTTWGNARSFGMSFYYSLFVMRGDGSVVTSGYDGAGELGLGSVVGGSTLGPVAVRSETCTSVPCADTLTGVTALASGSGAATLALKNGQILGWGSRGSGLLGPVASGSQPFPRPVASPGVSGFTALSASHLHALVIGPGNVVYAWGSGLRGTLGDGTGNDRTAPGMVTVP